MSTCRLILVVSIIYELILNCFFVCGIMMVLAVNRLWGHSSPGYIFNTGRDARSGCQQKQNGIKNSTWSDHNHASQWLVETNKDGYEILSLLHIDFNEPARYVVKALLDARTLLRSWLWIGGEHDVQVPGTCISKRITSNRPSPVVTLLLLLHWEWFVSRTC